MFSGHDHAIRYAADPAELDRLCGAFETAGFLITEREDEGRDNAPTRQKLVCFADGTYLELLTVADPAARARHRLARHMAGQGGWADFTVLTDRLEQAMAVQRAAGLPVQGPLTHEKRLADGRPWGVALALTGIGAGHPALPFLLEDRVGRELRIPRHRVRHPNGAAGLAGVVVRTPDLAEAARHYRPLFGEGQAVAGGGRRYDFAPDAWIALEEGRGGLSRVVLRAAAGVAAPAAAEGLGIGFTT